MVKKVIDRPYEKSCELIYDLASKRISERYKNWKNKNPKYNTQLSFYPSDSKLIGKIMKCQRHKNNPYLLTHAIQIAIMENLDFKDANELYWGDDVELYFEDLFCTLFLEVLTYRNFEGLMMENPPRNEEEIKNFYHTYRDLLLGKGESVYNEIYSLKDRFIDFTYNRFENNRDKEFEKLLEPHEDQLVHAKEGTETLTFSDLPKKLDIFAEQVLLEMVERIYLSDLIKNYITPESI